ncbi:MAG: hypothetical protein ISP32_02720 [Thermoleophilia bacterium]|nr:hypothetical protein [Thermoleophilia bacterium]
MPTSRRRYTVTETPRIEASLAAVRERFGDEAASLPDLIVLGAEALLERARADEERVNRSRRALAEMIRQKSLPGDADAGLEAHESGWVPTAP